MRSTNFHQKPFDEGTLTKLQIFELYTREWLPVFLSRDKPSRCEIHLFDFFAGPGTDSNGEFGSPLRILKQLNDCRNLAAWNKVKTTVHFFDKSPTKIKQLELNIQKHGLRLADITFDIRQLKFEDAFAECSFVLKNSNGAKLVFIDQCGVDHVTHEVFNQLVSFPTCDFLFFISSSTLHRFRDHPAIKQKITRPDDSFHVHRAALDYYRGFLPQGSSYYLAPFSIKKNSNIYGLIFGSAHPLGIDKFLQVAWAQDGLNGEADFDINRDNILLDQSYLLPDIFRPSKISAFERELEDLLRSGNLKNEVDVMRICFEHGVKRQHAKPVLAKLKREKIINADFRVPDVRHLYSPRPVQLITTP
jgi:three-Cys-motif partner protein